MLQLKIIHPSTRDARKGFSISQWLYDEFSKLQGIDIELVDLKAENLPFFNEDEMPIRQKYTHEIQQNWAKKIDAADAFVFVTCEYNHGMPASLKNALDYLSKEWNYKPAFCVGYGGMDGGARAIMTLKNILSTLRMFPVESINLPFFFHHLDENGKFIPNEIHQKAFHDLVKEVVHLGEGMKVLRIPAVVLN